MGIEMNSESSQDAKQPLLQQQQPQPISQPILQPISQPISQPILPNLAQPVLIPSPNGQPFIALPMAKYKVKPDLNCAGNFRQYKTHFPTELIGTFQANEYENIVCEINKIVNFNKIPVVLAILFQISFVIPIVIFAVNNNLPLMYTAIGCNIFAAFIVIFVSIALPRRMVRRLERHICYLNDTYASRNIRFEICPKYISRSGKKFHVKLYIRYPPVILTPIQQSAVAQPVPMYYTNPQQQPQYQVGYQVPIYTSQQQQQQQQPQYYQPPQPQQYQQQPPSYLNNVDNRN